LEIHEQVGQKVIWSLNQREEKFRLSLEPPHLGSIYMEQERIDEAIAQFKSALVLRPLPESFWAGVAGGLSPMC
jgi:tetratricopeptide (TPR) repeat protein